MRNRSIIAGAAVLMAAGLAMSGCKSSTSTASSASSPASSSPAASAPAASASPGGGTGVAPAKAALTAALAKLATSGGYDLSLSTAGGSTSGTGAVNLAKKSVVMNDKIAVATLRMSISAVQIGSKRWMKVDFGALNSRFGFNKDKWMLVDTSKLTGPNAKEFDQSSGDALDVAGLLSKMSNVKQSDATHFTGTVDLTGATGVTKPNITALKKAGSNASAMPFSVSLDSQGRPATVKIKPKVGNTALSVDITFSHYGSPSAITEPPAGQVVPAPAELYSILNKS